MTKMSWIRSSKSTALLALLLVTVAAVGTATAVTASATSAPEEAQVGEEVTVTVTLTDLYAENDDWTLNGTTQLQNVTGWEVTKVQPNGSSTTESFDGQQSFQTEIASADNLERVNLTITGDVPAVENYTYDPRQTFVAANLDRIKGDNVNQIREVTIHHYTEQSRQARQAIDDAAEAVDGSGSDEAQSDLDRAISVFESGNFDDASSLAQDAQDAAESAEQSQQTLQLALYGAGALVVLALIGGGAYWYRSQQDDYDKLR